MGVFHKCGTLALAVAQELSHHTTGTLQLRCYSDYLTLPRGSLVPVGEVGAVASDGVGTLHQVQIGGQQPAMSYISLSHRCTMIKVCMHNTPPAT
jgi:hypothetical protein